METDTSRREETERFSKNMTTQNPKDTQANDNI